MKKNQAEILLPIIILNLKSSFGSIWIVLWFFVNIVVNYNIVIIVMVLDIYI